ncbi:TlpA family protein disulfide reductase [Microbacterium sp. C5A9]|uniref:TlpA family protein disulfide reductase n=1 Tax=Microbacterium sp. C5A9 TaxID=2736663 RepID=UPI001F51D76B|nr:TlpA disulfide reductase family protein [Microbacterium sp. C5A9]MCI1018071.1 TlpA family protein disulfide reductase [Microbacterium sp. C5A9]
MLSEPVPRPPATRVPTAQDHGRRRRIRHAVLASIPVLLLLAGCASNDSLSQQYRDGNEKGFIAGDFQVVEIPQGERGEPVTFEGVTETEEQVASDDYRGDVLVVNFWYAACGPCIVEAPYLEQVWQDYRDDGVAFLGVNTYDQPATALSFAKDNGVTYPSVIDVNDGKVKLAFAQVTPIQATPTTLVIDRSGRVAARVIGQLDSASILATLVEDVLEESVP